MKRILTLGYPLSIIAFCFSCSMQDSNFGKTEITKWRYGKAGAISITYDDATINQFRQALPLMDTLGMKGTFFINTADIPGSQFPPKYFGRPLQEIVNESGKISTNKDNLFERATALRFMDIKNAIESHNSAGALYENEKYNEAFAVVDNALAEARKKKKINEKRPTLLDGELITWPEIKDFAKRGHEFGNHTISHPRLSVLMEQDLLYELEKCKEEIGSQLGPEHTFSAECPFGTENERVMQYAYKIHPALRNRMPESFLVELNRGNKTFPGEYKKEYIQWQRGPLKKTTVELMKSWVDTLLVHDNVWLVLTFHGIDNVGWEAKPHSELKEYFTYMKKHNDSLWIDTFGEVTKYMRQRMNGQVQVKQQPDRIEIQLDHSLDKTWYNVPMTLKTYVRKDWEKVSAKQGGKELRTTRHSDSDGNYILYEALPDGSSVTITNLAD